MPRIELSLKASYLPGWGRYEGMRELIQNARDAEVQDSAPMTVTHVYRTRDKRPVGAVVITNEGTTIPKEAFLIGHTTKEGRGDLIGQFGEGFKFGILALLRLGLAVKIRNGAETWVPAIARSEKFDAEVLVFDVSGGNKWEDRVSIEVLGVELDEWEKIRNNFLFLTPPTVSNTVETYDGRILLEPSQKGKLYVKGMFVCTDDQLKFGYDINSADIDRDRRMLSDKYAATSRLLNAALKAGKLTEHIYGLLQEGSKEVDSVYASWLGEDERQVITGKFLEQYGVDALPVETEAEATELGHLGKRGVKVPWNLRTILDWTLGSAQKNLKKLRMNAKHVYSEDELTERERANLSTAKGVLKTALLRLDASLDICDRITVVDFGDSKLMGTYDSSDGGVRLARTCLGTVAATLRVLIHEVAHVAGPDGSKQHEAMIGELTEAILSQFV